MRHRARPLLAMLLAGASGCAEPAPPGEPVERSTIPEAEGFTISSGLMTRERLVIRDASTWASVWSQIAAGVIPPRPVPVIDFGSRAVIVVAMGMRTSGGFQITIDDVRLVDGEVRVFVMERSPGDGCNTTGAHTAPIDAIAVPRFDGEAAFSERTSTTSCR